ncbi:hypothetical protein QQX98_008563 [Neonectria punicea]|uniref:Prolyl 4-hydroxylase alpha subunit Fe(2+) 2OG dioxygenase domain-containing protein n=1 Tax=Neonectria punicea TaxID=979145 RepID=A0ABR1GVW3_9HYPO
MANYNPHLAGGTLAHGHIQGAMAVSDSSAGDQPGELRKSLLDALNRIQTSGTFASFRPLGQAPPAGLFVNGVGHITMPLGESQARQLIALASQAPYGKGSDTIVDTSVRNTWELDADKFTFKDPAWPGFLQRICAAVAKDLGIEATVRAEVYKMLVYEKGAMFKAHTDTEKIPGMFGSLVICLPSAHQGGEVVLKHCGEKKIFKTSDFTQSIAYWYSDVSHEVLPVTSGYRWVVTYNLAINHAETRPSAGLQKSEMKDLRAALERWLAKDDEESCEREFVYHVLDHDYTEANVSLKMLKTQDFARVQALKDMSKDLPIEIFLALLEKEEMGGVAYDPYESRRRGYGYCDYEDEDADSEPDYHHIDDVLETKYTVKTLHDLEGHIVTQGLELDEDDILDENCFEDLEAEEEYEGFMGNSGPTATHWYRVTAVVIVPHESIPSFFDAHEDYSYSRQINFPLQICYLAQKCLQPQAQESIVTALVKLCKKAWENSHTTVYGRPELGIDGEGMRYVLKIAIQLGQYALFEEAAVKNTALLPLDFFIWLREWLVSSNGNASDRLNVINKGLTSIVSAYSHFADQYQALAIFAPLSQNDAPDSVMVWARATLRSCLDASGSKPLGKEDGLAMADLALYLNDSFTLLSATVVARIEKKHDVAAFVLAFLARLREQSTKGALPLEQSMQLHQTVARSFNTWTDFTQIRSDAGAQLTDGLYKRPRYYTSVPSHEPGFQTTINLQELVDYFSAIVQKSTETDDLAELLVSKIVADAPRFNSYALWIPFLRSLIPILTSNAIPLNTACYQQLFLTVMKAYVNRYVGLQPTKDKSLIRPNVRCSCADCERLNAFLSNATQTTARFSMNKQRRQHLHQQLDGARIDCGHATERIGSPQTLVVTKRFQQNDSARREWAARRAKAAEEFGLFDHGHLRVLLGSEYSKIVNTEEMSAVRLPRASVTAPLPTTSQPNPSPLVSRTKRKAPPMEADVIDLTSD